MSSFAYVVGRLTKDPQLNKTAKGTSVLNITVASNSYRGEKTVDWIKATIWGHDAEFLNRYAHKGSIVHVSGELATSQFKNRDGYDVTETYINVGNGLGKVDLLDQKQNTQERQEAKQAPAYTPTEPEDKFKDDEYTGDDDPSLNITADDLPF